MQQQQQQQFSEMGAVERAAVSMTTGGRGGVSAYVASLGAACSKSTVARAVLRDPTVCGGRVAILWSCEARRGVYDADEKLLLEAATEEAAVASSDDALCARALLQDAAEVISSFGSNDEFFSHLTAFARGDARRLEEGGPGDLVSRELSRQLGHIIQGSSKVGPKTAELRRWAIRGAVLIIYHVCGTSAAQFSALRVWRYPQCWRAWCLELLASPVEEDDSQIELRAALTRAATIWRLAPRASHIHLRRALNSPNNKKKGADNNNNNNNNNWWQTPGEEEAGGEEETLSVEEAVEAVRSAGSGADFWPSLSTALLLLKGSSKRTVLRLFEELEKMITAEGHQAATSKSARTARLSAAAAAVELRSRLSTHAPPLGAWWASKVLFEDVFERQGSSALAAAAPAIARFTRAEDFARALRGLLERGAASLKSSSSDSSVVEEAAAFGGVVKALGALGSLKQPPGPPPPPSEEEEEEEETPISRNHLEWSANNIGRYGAGQLVRIWAANRPGSGLAFASLRRAGGVRARLESEVSRLSRKEHEDDDEDSSEASSDEDNDDDDDSEEGEEEDFEEEEEEESEEELCMLLREVTSSTGGGGGVGLLDALAMLLTRAKTKRSAMGRLACATVPALVARTDGATLAALVAAAEDDAGCSGSSSGTAGQMRGGVALSESVERSLAEVLLSPGGATRKHFDFVRSSLGPLYSKKQQYSDSDSEEDASKSMEELCVLHLDAVLCLVVAELGSSLQSRADRARAGLERLAGFLPKKQTTNKRRSTTTRSAAAASSSEVSALVSSKLLMILTDVVHVGWRRCGRNAQSKRLRALGACLEYLDAAVAFRYAPNVLSTLVAAVDAREAEVVAVDVLCRFARRLPVEGLRAYLGTILSAVLPSAEGGRSQKKKAAPLLLLLDGGEQDQQEASPPTPGLSGALAAMARASERRAAALIRWLVVERLDLVGSFPGIPLPPRRGGPLEDCRRALAAAEATRATRDRGELAVGDPGEYVAPLKVELSRLAPLMDSADLPTQEAAVRCVLRRLLGCENEVALAGLLQADMAGSSSRLVALELRRLLGSLLRLTTRGARLGPLAASAIGALGAPDPARLRHVELSAQSDDGNKKRCILGEYEPPKQGTPRCDEDSDDDGDDDDDAQSNKKEETNLLLLPTWRLGTTVELAATLAAKYVVEDVKQRRSHRSHDCAAFSLQELVKLCLVQEDEEEDEEEEEDYSDSEEEFDDGTTSKRKRKKKEKKKKKKKHKTPASSAKKRGREDSEQRLSKAAKRVFIAADCLELVQAYAHTDYVISTNDIQGSSSNVVVQSHSGSGKRWLGSWVRRLTLGLEEAARKTPSKGGGFLSVLVACRASLLHDERLAAALLPYVVYEALCCVDAAVGRQLVVAELEAVLSLEASGRPMDAVILQLLFALQRTLESWRDDALALEARGGNPPPKPANGKASSACIDLALDAMPLEALAHAAYRCGATARAALYYERSLRAATLKDRLREKPSSTSSRGGNVAQMRLHEDGADGFLPRLRDGGDVDALQRLAAEMDEDPDYLRGLAARRRCMSGLEGGLTAREQLLFRVREETREAMWPEALAGLEAIAKLSEDDEQDLPSLVRCLMEMGQVETGLIRAEAALAKKNASCNNKKNALAALGAEASWRLGKWDRLATLVATFDVKVDDFKDEDGHLGVARCVHAYERLAASVKEEEQSSGARLLAMGLALERSRREAVDRLSAAAMESYSRCYPWCAQLALLREIEDAAQLVIVKKSDANFFATRLRARWATRLEALATPVATRCLALRRCLLEVAGLPLEAAKCSVASARLARQGGLRTIARRELHEAKRLGFSPRALALKEAKLLRLRSAVEAYTVLEPQELDVGAARQRFGLGLASDFSMDALLSSNSGHFFLNTVDEEEEETRRLFAKRLLLATDCIVSARLRHGAEVVRRYELLVALRPTWGKAYAAGARYFDLLLSLRCAQLAESSDQPNKPGDNLANFDAIAQSHATEAMRWYARSLEYTAERCDEALSRLLTLWFEFTALGNSSNSGESISQPSGGKKQQPETASSKRAHIVRGAADRVAATVWFGAVPQLVSRAGHPSTEIRRCVVELLGRLLHAQPHQALWALTGLTLSVNHQRADVGRRVMSKAKVRASASQRGGPQSLALLIDAAGRLFADLTTLAKCAPSDGTKRLDLKRIVSDADACKMLVPTRHALTATLPPSSSSSSSSRSKDATQWPVFPSNVPHIARLGSHAVIMKSKARPKKLNIVASDGRRSRLLCKREKDGDFRKDARINDFNECINRLLMRCSPEARARKLRLRTYAVIILDEECGLCEWVRDTHGLRFVIERAYSLQTQKKYVQFHDERLRNRLDTIQQEHRLDAGLMAAAYKKEILPLFAPCLSRWFERKFGLEPATWLEARARFTTSAACWAGVGHIVGLGDRHGENILIDVVSGECVHVDFDCILDKGTKLKRPEVVPFRLTPHMVEAFGVVGVDGLFRRSLEIVLGVAREHCATLLNVLEPFVRDPSVGWARSGKAQRDSEGGGYSTAHSSRNAPEDDPRETLHRISQRIKGVYNLPVPPPPGSARDRDLKDSARDERAAARGVGTASSRRSASSSSSAILELPLSVPGQVERLISEATDVSNLCRMYIGWTPFL